MKSNSLYAFGLVAGLAVCGANPPQILEPKPTRDDRLTEYECEMRAEECLNQVMTYLEQDISHETNDKIASQMKGCDSIYATCVVDQ